jgi:hypothetical protein
MRTPPDFKLSQAELRVLVVLAVAHGNQPGMESSFLHSTGSLTKCVKIRTERRHLYSNWLVRWPRECVDERIDFDRKKDKYKWLQHEDPDSSLVEECLKICRSYVQKDSEVVYLRHPGMNNIQWWDEPNATWRKATDIPNSFVHAATSQKWVRTVSEERRDRKYDDPVIEVDLYVLQTCRLHFLPVIGCSRSFG